MERSDQNTVLRARREVRLATFVQCDIVDSTRIFGQLDYDEQAALRDAFENAVVTATTRRDGEVVRWHGDGALISFGYPEAHVNAAELAVRMGLELVDSVRAIRVVPRVQIEVRVGIASGHVAVELDRSQARQPAVDGQVAPMAERLRERAQPSRVLITDATKTLTGGYFDYRDAGIRDAKGFVAGLQAWEVVGETLVTSRYKAHRSGGSREEIIGRGGELAILSEAWAASLKGRGRAVCLIGDPGMGKSRLARVTLDHAAQENALVLEVDCTPSTLNSPLFPIGVMLRRTAQIRAGTSNDEKSKCAKELLARFLTRKEVKDAFPFLSPLFGIETPAELTTNTPTQVRDQTIAILVKLLRKATVIRPVAILCEDLHWADATTKDVLGHFVQHVAELQALLIVTAWPEEKPSFDLAHYTMISLESLLEYQSAELVRSVAKHAALPTDVIEGIVYRSEGVPLLIEEITRTTLEAARRGEAVSTHAPSSSTSAQMALIVQSRLERLVPHKPVVEAASVLGREFSIGALEQVVADESVDTVSSINALANHGLFEQPVSSNSNRVRFKHAMIRDAVYETLTPVECRRLHSCAADTLSALYRGTPDASPEVLAEHLCAARRFVEAIETRIEASCDAANRGAFVEAEGHCVAALKQIENVEDLAKGRMLQIKLLSQLGVARTGRYGYAAQEVEDAYLDAQSLFDGTTEPEMRYPVIRGLTAINLVRGNLATAFDLSPVGLELAEQSNRAEFRIDAMSVHSYTTLYYGRLEDCRIWIKRCLALYKESNGDKLRYPVPHDAATAALAILPTVEWLLGDCQAAEKAIGDGLAHVKSLNRDFDKAMLYAWVAGTRYTQRRYMEALQHAKGAYDIAAEHKFEEWVGTGGMLALLAQSALQPTLQGVVQAINICKKFGEKGVLLNASYYLWGIARGFANAGDVPAAQTTLAQALGAAAASKETRMDPEIWILQAELETDNEKARNLLVNALELAQSQGAIAIALRAAAGIVMRFSTDSTEHQHARTSLDYLDGRQAYPDQSDWMKNHLAEMGAHVRTQRLMTQVSQSS